MKFVFSPDVILCVRLGSKYQLTNYILQPKIGQIIAMHASLVVRNLIFLICPFPVHSSSFSQILLTDNKT